MKDDKVSRTRAQELGYSEECGYMNERTSVPQRMAIREQVQLVQ